MKVKDVLDDYHLELYELNTSISAPTMYGAMLFRGNAKLLENSPHCEKNIFRLFEYNNIGKTVIIVN